MKNIITILFWLVLCLPAMSAADASDRYEFMRISCEQGLSQSNVKAIVRDRDGFMWFGTKNGLNRFDGTKMVHVKCADRVAGKENQNISALCAGRDGTLWVGTDKGVFRYDPVTDRFTYLSVATQDGVSLENWVLNITEDSEGNVWMVIPSQGVFRYKDGDLHRYPDVSNPPSHLYVRHDNEVWIATWGEGLYHYDKVHDRFVLHAKDKNGNPLTGLKIAMMCDYDGGMALGIHEGRLMNYDPRTDVLMEISCPGLASTMVRTVCAFKDELWIGTYEGIFVMKEKVQEVLRLSMNPSRSRALSDNVIYAVYPDGNDGVWVGTLCGGVNYHYDSGAYFEKYMCGGVPAFPEPARILEMVAVPSGEVWIGTENEGVCVFQPRTGEAKRYSLPGTYPSVLSVAYAGRKVFFSFFQSGLYAVDLEDGSRHHYTCESLGLGEANIYSIHVDGRGIFWMGTDRGLYKAEPDEWTFRKVEGIGEVWVFDIFESHEGKLWLGTMGDGLRVYEPMTGKVSCYMHEDGNPRSLGSNSVSSVMQGRNGVIWISTDRGGLCRYDAGGDAFTVFSVDDGLPDDVVYGILEDGHGDLWMGTNKGLVCFNPETKSVRRYTTENGLPGNQFNYKSALKGADGRLYFGGVNGLVVFDIEGMKGQGEAAPLYFTRLSVNHQEVVSGTPGSLLQASIVHTDEVRLSYDYSNITFGVSLLNYAAPSSSIYYYCLEPLDKDWNRALDHHDISYSHLPAGNYTLKVKAVNGLDGTVSTKVLSLVVLPPWWRTWWAYTLYIIIGVGVVCFSVWNYRRGQERRMRIRQRFFEMEKEKAIYEEKMRLYAQTTGEDVVTGQPEPPVQSEEVPELAMPKEVPMSEADRKWAEHMLRVIEDNLMDESFNVEAMAEILCMSRSTLLRKVKLLFDRSPVDIIRTMRLKKAAELIREGSYRVGDIGYMVGFSSASYFSKNFQRQFGMPPKEFAKQCQGEREKMAL